MAPKRKKKVVAKKALTKDQQALKIQGMIRKFLARVRMKHVSMKQWGRVFEPKIDQYFFYNTITGKSQWQVPRWISLWYPEDIESVIKFQKIARGFLGRVRSRRLAKLRYSKFYDQASDKVYFMNTRTEETFWEPSEWLYNQKIELTPDDQALYDSVQKIKQLEKMLMQKEEEIKEVKLKRFEDLENEVVLDKVANAKNLTRVRHMDDWSIDDLCAFFVELKMEQYCKFLYQNKVDGLMWLNLDEDAWVDIGIDNKFYMRKMQLIMPQYVRRYQKRLERQRRGDEDEEEDEEDEDEGTEYTPSELSDIVRQEGVSDSESDVTEDSEEMSEEEEDEFEYEMTEEERLEAAFDAKHLSIEITARGDDETYPQFGDIVRVRYSAFVIADPKNKKLKDVKPVMVTSTKTGLQRPWVEFIIGNESLVKGFDRAMPKMSYGERAKLYFTPTYAYGPEGLPPIIPPDSHMMFDVTVLGFRQRKEWIKPMIQSLGLSEKPYMEEDTGDGLHGVMEHHDDAVSVLSNT
mmetsp:Transcript_17203/g.28787  ORF Transcript_17203/g.28787 Transcript_17203/m.28787 type:complete len:519 (-) Transcript_17203:140-1696(-)|eukprot:CAMPEP_0114429214 /NCGR_PEP_ID=MMETSP0103-20121206/9356_1 /TAXON_ID=37642 ORGANISM="Paraphysomonas imperforata, Strain PA2" /NCGR_SAMPLE_ID=MMETSP0103 /ASSEMBLY_ACC=CAM_ASM_000201 /LENGTH=518 /DNA_ID=CAMNT_0001598515 /DNA_START=96 /DNA_END=1652 /DNA_ORIENTATION=+